MDTGFELVVGGVPYACACDHACFDLCKYEYDESEIILSCVCVGSFSLLSQLVQTVTCMHTSLPLV